LNYIRNSVKVVVDAYNGTTTFYVTDSNEPIIKAYTGIFPALFKPIDQMPASERAHVRYPELSSTCRPRCTARSHDRPAGFLQQGRFVAVPNDSSGTQSQVMEPYYVIMRLPGETKEEFMLMLPFTPAKRQNMVAWMSAKSDGADYGKRLVYDSRRTS